MAETPNIEVLRELLNKIDSEFDLESRLNRYISVTPELVELAKNSGLSSDLDAARALFVSDFVVSASEMPANTSDEDRRKIIIDSFLKGLMDRNKSSDKLMRIFFLAMKTSSLIRRTDLFLADRGLNREPSLIMLKDFYIEPYLSLCSEFLGKGSCGWELSILSALLKKTFPTNEFEFFTQAPKYSPDEDLSYYLWNMLETYSESQLLTPNTQIVIPNVENTSTALVGSSKPEFSFSFWNIDTPHSSLKDNQNALEFLHKYLGKTDNSRPLVYLRARIPKLQQQFIVVRNPFSDLKPFIIMKTPADEINLSEALTILGFRSREAKSWRDITKPPKKAKKQPSVSQNSTSTPFRSQKSEVPEEKKSFFSKIFGGLLGKSDDKGTSQSLKEDKPKPKIESKKKKHRDKSRQKGNSNLPYFLSHALTASLVGDLQLFEIFDTYRESKYAIQGSLELDYQTKKTKLITRKKLDSPQAIGELVNGLDSVLTTIIKHFFAEEIHVIPEEILFVSKNDLRTIVCLESSDDRLVGTIGTTFVKDVVDWRSKEENIVQRRTLRMRTGQLLQARRHTPLDEAINRIYQGALDEEVDEMTLEQKSAK
ncbi:MAG: hypothetical protein HeimC3_06790 [Candidatus Heimdallarchaeota archaeon LC_3]|nr:MAG: hypothetical protein HeimC3_06790 [Candidatus Heimdallarchaeota archaeon LC_3]